MEDKDKFRTFLDKHKILKTVVKFLVYEIYFTLTSPFRNFFRTIYSHDKYLAQLHIVADVHKGTFSKYKNKHQGQDIVLIATGPSLNKYKSIPNTINIGVNKALLYNKISLDYYFAQDYLAVKDYLYKTKEYPNKNLVKFFGQRSEYNYSFPEIKGLGIIPESKIIEFGAKKYFSNPKYPPYNVDFNTDIDKTLIIEGGSVIFAAIQFALYTNPKKIYIVGCDCSTGYFDEAIPKIRPNKNLVKTWRKLKKFADTYYPDTEIVSVNPVGLKGMFNDLYQ